MTAPDDCACAEECEMDMEDEFALDEDWDESDPIAQPDYGDDDQ